MYEYDEECLKVFLEKQLQLFDEPVAETLEEAEAFLEDCMAVVVDSLDEVRDYFEVNSRIADRRFSATSRRSLSLLYSKNAYAIRLERPTRPLS